jgi:predicted aspartyl protease
MSTAFDPKSGLILVDARLDGPLGGIRLRLAVDTGANRTLISPSILAAAGYDGSQSKNFVNMTTASGVERVTTVTISELKVLGREFKLRSVIAHTLPASATIDGLLGLDFFRGLELKIDFRNGVIELA